MLDHIPKLARPPCLQANFETRLAEVQLQILRFVRHRVPHRDDAAEVLQETNLALLKNRENYDNNRDFLPWALAFAQKQILSHRRKLARERTWFARGFPIVKMSVQVKAEPQPQMERLGSAVEKLTQRQRWLFEQRYFHGKSIPELANTVKQSPNCLAACFLRIRRRLLQSLEWSTGSFPCRNPRRTRQVS
jgi:RNA polymerase sigma-70 factor (ECF subfamily)